MTQRVVVLKCWSNCDHDKAEAMRKLRITKNILEESRLHRQRLLLVDNQK